MSDHVSELASAASLAANGTGFEFDYEAMQILGDLYGNDGGMTRVYDSETAAYVAKQTAAYIEDNGHKAGWGYDGGPRCFMGAAGSVVFGNVDAYGGKRGALQAFGDFVHALAYDDLARLKRFAGIGEEVANSPTSAIMVTNDNKAYSDEAGELKGGAFAVSRLRKLARRLSRRATSASITAATEPETADAPAPTVAETAPAPELVLANLN